MPKRERLRSSGAVCWGCVYDGRTGEGARRMEEDGVREKALLFDELVDGGDCGREAP